MHIVFETILEHHRLLFKCYIQPNLFMQFKVFSSLTYQVFMPSTFIFNVQAAITTHQQIIEEQLTIDSHLQLQPYTTNNGTNRFLGLSVYEPQLFTLQYQAIVDVQHTLIDVFEDIQAYPFIEFSESVVPYLFPSRYCESDKLQKFAFKEFGHIQNKYEQVLCICEWIFEKVEYINGSTNSFTSAFNTITERVGVCRDFAHVGIALCRALSIPARYCSVYAHHLFPPDFHACFEAYIGGKWIFFDPTKLVPVNGMVFINVGKDASTAAFASIYGNSFCTAIEVSCEAIETNFTPYYYQQNVDKVVAYT